MIIPPYKEVACTAATTAWLHEVWLLIEQGRPVQPDPFYTRNAVLTPAVVKNVIDNVEAIFVSELAKYPGYHHKAQGISASEYLVPPGFDKLSQTEQLAVTQGIDRIFQEHRSVAGAPVYDDE